jgi:hypothetical protein
MRLTSSSQWVDYFAANEQWLLPTPWHLGAEVTPEELRSIARSLQAWQLGETSDGRHLRACAQAYALKVGDPEFPAAVEWFIREEQRHGESLGKFLDLAGVPRIQCDWGDTCFRAFRYALVNMECWVTVVIMVENLALVYYAAIRSATRSTLLKRICQQILHDELPHIRFQYERLAILHARRSWWLRQLTHLAQRVLYFGVVLAVWYGHKSALRAGGHSFGSYWRTSWRKMNFAWERMRPENFDVSTVPIRSPVTACNLRETAAG